MQSTSLRAPTRYEQERIEAMLRLGCVACAVLGIPYVEVQCHHILDGTVRMGHWFTLPVCAGHHKGEFTALQRRLLVEVAAERNIKHNPLVAIHTGRKAYARVYGTEKQQWTRVQERLRLPAVWPSSKILPRRGYEPVEMASDAAEVLLGSMAVPLVLPRSQEAKLGSVLTGGEGSGQSGPETGLAGEAP